MDYFSSKFVKFMFAIGFLYPYFVQKTSIHKKTRYFQAHILIKNFHFLKNTMLSYHLFHVKHLLSCPYLVKKTSNLSKLHYIMGQKLNKIPFSQIFHETMTALMPIFCQKNAHSLKITLLACPYFVKKLSILSKTHCSM